MHHMHHIQGMPSSLVRFLKNNLFVIMIMSILPRAILRPSWRISLDIIELDLLVDLLARVDLAKYE